MAYLVIRVSHSELTAPIKECPGIDEDLNLYIEWFNSNILPIEKRVQEKYPFALFDSMGDKYLNFVTDFEF
jgi:hypothetical protein